MNIPTNVPPTLSIRVRNGSDRKGADRVAFPPPGVGVSQTLPYPFWPVLASFRTLQWKRGITGLLRPGTVNPEEEEQTEEEVAPCLEPAPQKRKDSLDRLERFPMELEEEEVAFTASSVHKV
ncbi:unnamed protein product [Boreogadus saida]